MKVRNLVLSSLLVIVFVLVFAFALGLDTNKESQVAFASNDSQTSVCFDEGNTLWFNTPDDNIYCHGAESFDEDSTGAFARIDYSTDSIHFYKPSTNPIKSITGTCEQLKLIFDEAGTYNLDAIDFDGTGEGLSLYSTLTLTASVPGVVVNLHKLDCQGSILYIEGYITVNVIGTDSISYHSGIVECDSLGLFDHASLHVSADSRLGNHLHAYILCREDINVLFMTDGDLSVDTTKEDSNDEIYCIKCNGRLGRGPGFYFGEIESISLKTKNQDHLVECYYLNFNEGVSGKKLENNTGKFNSYIIDRIYYYELVISKMYTYTVSFYPNGDVTSGEMPPVDGIKGEYVIPECQFVKEGQKFLRWNADGNNYFPGMTINVNKDILLYAIWENVAFPIEFQANGGSGTMDAFMGYKGMTIDLPKCTFEAPTNYEFKCWSIGGVEKAVGASYTIQDDTPIIAVWKSLPTYNITFDKNGGTGSMDPDSSHPKYTLPTCDFTAPAGYDFRGWTINSVDGATYQPNDEIILTGDTTLYAYWAENDPMVVTYDDGEGNTYMFLIPEGGEVTVKSFAELGFVAPLGETFSQWRKHIGTPHTLYAPNEKFTITENVYLMAQFNYTGETVCTISFSAGEGTGDMTEVKVLEGTEYSLPLCGYTAPSGKTFKCWDILSVEYQPLQKITVSENITVNANFREPVSIAFDYKSYALINGKLNTQYLDVRLVYDDQSEEPIDYESCEFYVGTEIIPANLITDIANYIFTEKGNNTISVTYSTFDAASSFVMVKEQFTVSFNNNGGSGSIDDEYRFENTKFVLPANSFTAPANKEFKCWSVGGIEKQPDDELTITADVEVKAVWQDETFVVAFEANGGKGNKDIVEHVRGTYNLPENPFTAPSGKQFKGWALAANGDKISTSSINVTDNTLLYALWEPLPTYTVSFNANGGTGTMNPINGVSGSYTLPTNAFTAPQGKQFKCWSVGGVEKAAGTQITVSENTTVTAVWEDIPAQDPEPQNPDPEQGGSGENGNNGNNNSNNNSENSISDNAKKPLGGGAIAGIVIACVVALAGVGVGVFFLLKKKGIIGKK